MGFFKKMGTAVKKGLKQVSLKNAVKLGTPFLSAIPIFGGAAQTVVSGISEGHELKKQSKILAQQGKIEESNALALQAEQISSASGQIVGQQVGTQYRAFAKGASQELMAQVSTGTQSAIGTAGASVVDFTIKEWFQKHLSKILLVLGASGLAIWYFKNRQPVKRSSNYRRK